MNKSNSLKTLFAAMLGTIIEWFDYGIFWFLAPVLAKLFFPTQNKWLGLLEAFMVLAIGYFLRPLGAFIFGSFADRFGRVTSLRTTILLISLPSLVIGCLPTYDSIGSIATGLLIFLRLLQGISVGGEFAGSMVYLTETAPAKYRTLYSGLANNSSNIGILAGAGICALLTAYLSPDHFLDYGWRIPFILGGFLGIVGYRLRKFFIESDIFLKLQAEKKLQKEPVITLFTKYQMKLLVAIFLCWMGASGIYTLTSYLSTYLQLTKHYSLDTALSLQSVLLVTTLILVPICSLLGNRFGQIPLLKFAAIGNIAYSVFAFSILPENNIIMVGIILLPLILFISFEQGLMPATLAEFFPASVRYSGVSIAYNITYAYVGGTSPMYITWLMSKTHNYTIPGICIAISSAVTWLALTQYKKAVSS